MVERFGDMIQTASHEEEATREKHTPFIEAPDTVKVGEEFEVTVIVGKEVPHPNKWEHHIKWVQVFVEEEGRPYNPVHVATFDMGPTYGEPKVKFRMKLQKNSKLWVISYGNLHGLWEASKEIKVQ
ncbi:MAG: class II SORL domain-containing protein [Candidatus Korarchaeota archaeon]|nr:class II SORL domain-containing protein [Candidatus Korarchaeota archaeon]